MNQFIIFFLLVTGMCSTATAQIEIDRHTHGSFKISPESQSLEEDNSQIIQPKKTPLPPIKPQTENPNTKQKTISMIDDRGLMDAGEELQKKWDKRDKKIMNAYQKDQYLGTFGIKGTFFSVECRDHEYVDGDRVKIYINGILVEHNMILTSWYKGVNANLVKGKNTIEFVALNQGTSGPNTAQFRVLNDKGQIVTTQEWNLLTGVKASLIIFKKD